MNLQSSKMAQKFENILFHIVVIWLQNSFLVYVNEWYK